MDPGLRRDDDLQHARRFTIPAFGGMTTLGGMTTFTDTIP
jgi:hypothetical protein